MNLYNEKGACYQNELNRHLIFGIIPNIKIMSINFYVKLCKE